MSARASNRASNRTPGRTFSRAARRLQLSVALLALALVAASGTRCRSAYCAPSDPGCNASAWLLYALGLVGVGTVTPLYGGGSQTSFGGYITNDSPNGTAIGASGTTCDPLVSGFRSCFRSGVLFQAPLDRGTCDDAWTIRDSLGLFKWRCAAGTEPGTARQLSGGFADGMGLADAIDFAQLAYKPLRVEIYDASGSGGALGISPEIASLWTNPILNADAGIAAASAVADTIYALSDPGDGSYALDANGVALVVQPGVIDGSAGTGSTVTITAPFVYVEGDFDGGAAANAIDVNARHGTLRNASMFTTGANAVIIRGENALLHSVTTAGEDFTLNATARYSVMSRLRLQNSAGQLLDFTAASENYAADVIAAAGNIGVLTGGGALDGALLNFTSAAHGQMGLFTGTGDTNWLIQNGLAVNLGVFGFLLAPTNWSVLGYGATNADTAGVRLSGSATFRGALTVGSNATDCDNAAGTGLSSTCAAAAASEFTLRSGASAATAFVGRITVDDAANTGDTSGSSGAGLPTDWAGFENQHRSWALDSADPTVPLMRGACAGGCRIWDWSLRADDANFLNVNPDPQVAGTYAHSFTTRTAEVLMHAVEILNDGYGNENLLCDAPDERCLYSPNLGAYQGHGNIVFWKRISVGGLGNIELFRYEFNGR